MNSELRATAIEILDHHRLMGIATNRSDGWPQVTMVGYANDDLILYFFISRLSQKFANIEADSRVSAAIGHNFSEPDAIKGISLAGHASVVTRTEEIERGCAIFFARFPEFSDWQSPSPAISPLMKIKPEILSVIDYSKGFGHSDLVRIEESDLRHTASQPRSDWLGQSR